MTRAARMIPLAGAMLLAGCVVLPPPGPSIQALPGSKMSFQQFQFDDAACRQHAVAQVGGRGAGEAAQESAAARRFHHQIHAQHAQNLLHAFAAGGKNHIRRKTGIRLVAARQHGMAQFHQQRC